MTGRSGALAALVLAAVLYVGCEGAVGPDPNPPVALDVIAEQSVAKDDSVALDLTDHFGDPDGDTLVFTARTSDALVASASVSGTGLTLRALSPGRATVTVTATDPGGLSVEQVFQVTVPNRPPEAVGTIAGLELLTGEDAGVDVADHFTDPDGGALSYTVSTRSPVSADTSNVAASVSGAVVTVKAVFPGEAAVTVTATDEGGLAAEQAFAVTVPNRPPEAVGAIAGVEVFKYDGGGVRLAGHFTDPDGEVLRYAAETSNGTVAAASVSGDTLTVLGVAQGQAVVTVTASDPGGLTAEQTVAVTVPNRAPGVAGPIPGVEVFKYDSAAVAVSAHFADPDGDELSYAAETSNGGVAAVAVAGDRVTVRAVVQGLAAVTVTASDSAGASAEQVFAVTVPNRPPGAVGSIAEVEVFKFDAGRVDVSGYFADPDGEPLSYAAATSNGVVAAVAVAGDRVTVSGMAQGEAAVTVTASDSAGASAEQVFVVAVPNRPPGAVGSVPEVEVFKYDTGRVDVSAYFADPDRDELSYVAATSNAGVVAAAAAGDGVMVSGVVQGRAEVTVVASDSAGASAEQVFVVTVPNRAPEAVGAVGGLELFKGDSGLAEVSAHFRDPDGDALGYAAETSDPGVAAVSVSGGAVRVWAMGQGQAVVTVVASDSAGASAGQAFKVTVPNRAPEAVGALAGLELFRGDSGRTEVSAHFSDPDGDPLGYAAETSDPGVAVATVAGGTVGVLATGQGEATVTVTASDPHGGSAARSYAVTVPNRVPEALREMPAVRLFKGGSRGLDASAHFGDPDGDALSYAAVSSDAGVVAVSVLGDVVTVGAAGQGEASVTVTASDPHGGSAAETFAVTVPNRPPEVIGPIPDLGTSPGGSRVLDLSRHLRDPDGDALDYTAESSDAGVAAVWVSGAALTVSGLVDGTAEVTVTASDPFAASVRQDFTVTVVNRAPEAVGAIAAVEVLTGDTVRVDVSEHFRDPDGDPLSYTAAISGGGVAAVRVSGATVSVRGVSRGRVEVTVTASDPLGLTAVQTFPVTVPNRPPEPMGAMPAMEAFVGDRGEMDASEYFSDPDGDALDYAAGSSNPEVVRVSVSRETVTVAPVGTGEAAVTVTASDGGGLTARQSFAVTVPNRAPELIEAIADLEVSPGGSREVHLSEYFADPDGDDLDYAAESSDPGVAAVSLSGTTLDVSGVQHGTVVVTVTASDSEDLTAEQQFSVTVVTPNRAPEPFGSIPSAELMPDSSLGVNASRYFTDPDSDPLTYTATSSNTAAATVRVSGSTVTVTGEAEGSAEITVTATDPDELSATQEFTVTIRIAARSDLLVDQPEAEPDEVAPGDDFTLSVVVRNRGGAAASSGTTLRYYRSTDGTIDTGDTEIGTAGVPKLGAAKTSSESLEVSAPSTTGEYHYGACADTVNNESDTGNNCSAAVKVTVTQSNRAPRAVGSIPARDVLPDSSLGVDVSAYFTDPDSDPLVYTATSSNTAKATVAASGSTVTLTAKATGSARITVTATDPDELSATQRFTVTVRTTARSDLVVESPAADPDEVEPGGEFTLGGVVRNQGTGGASSGTTLRYYRSADADIDTDDTRIGTDDVPKLDAAKTSDRSHTVTGPTDEGTYYYGACADTVDNESDMDNNCSDAVAVTVARPNQAPVAVGSIPAQTVVEKWGWPLKLAIASYFSDPDGDDLRYTASSSDREAALVYTSGSEISIYGQAEGSAVITVTATDPGDLSATQELSLTVLGPRSDQRVRVIWAVPDSLGTEDDLRLDMWTWNAGNATSSSAPTVRFYRSEDGTIGRDDTELKALQTVELPPQKHFLSQWTTRAPADTGTYYYGGCIDAVDNEFDEDNNCSSARRVRVVNVRGKNRLPEYYRPIKTVNVREGDTASINLNRHFRDPDGDTLTYSATSDDTEKAVVSVSDSMLDVIGIKEGKLYGNVRATDPGDLWRETYFDICVTPCVINPSRFYLTQTVQSIAKDTPTEFPLMADEKALLRVFVVSSLQGDAVIPKVRATFVKPGEWTREVTVPAGTEKIPLKIDEGDLAKSANAEIPASWIRPDVEVYVTIDPDNTLPDSLRVNKRVPKTGSWTIDARTVPSLEFTLVPFVWTEDPDSTVEEWANNLLDSADFAPAQYPFELLPVKEVDGSVHDLVETDSSSTYRVLLATRAIRTAESGTGYYMGLIGESDPEDLGLAILSGWVSASVTNGRVVGHELGHNLSLDHAPACGPYRRDVNYPYSDGSIGHWGYDFRGDSLLPPLTSDLMGLCASPWISDYHFEKALGYRTRNEYRPSAPAGHPTESLLLWGGVDADGRPFLEPAIVVDAVPSLPTGTGPYRLVGNAEDGAELFSFRFDMPELADGHGGSVFAFAIPVGEAWTGAKLAGVTLHAGSRTATLDRDTDRPLVFLRDPVTRQVRGIFHEMTDAVEHRIEAARRRGLEVLISRGIPDFGN